MKRRNLAALTAAATAVAVIPAAGAMAASAGNDGRTVLPNSGVVHAEGLSVKGAAASTQQMSLAFQLPMRNQDLANHLVQNGVVLSQAQYRAYFSPSRAQMKKVADWAQSQGFKVTQTSRLSGQVMVHGTVNHVNKAFKVHMHRATLDGSAGLTVDKAPSVPAKLGLSGIAGLNSVHKMKTHDAMQPNSQRSTMRSGAAATSPRKMSTSGVGIGGHRSGLRGGATTHTSGKKDACASHWGDSLYPGQKVFKKESNFICGYLPQDLVQMYDAKKANSKAPNIGVLLWGNDPNMKTLTNQYMTQAGYPLMKKYTATVAKPDKHMKECDPEGVKTEQSIDVQSSHSIAPNSHIYYYGAASCYDDALTAMLQKAVDQHKVSTISMSFGTASDRGMTRSDMARWDRPLLQASLTGISTFASSGDDGDNSAITQDGKAHVGYPASSGYTTAVGGTSVGLAKGGSMPVQAGWETRFFVQSNPDKSGKTDVTSSLGYSGAGGGVSTVSTRPSWQKGVVSYSGSKRAVPDIAGIADPYTGFTIKDNAGYATYGGTSLASPVVGAVSAIAKAKNNARIGNLAPLFYRLEGSRAIKDINSPGNSGVWFGLSKNYNVVGFDGHTQSLVSKSGWDNVTGVGVPGGAAFYSAIK